MSTEKLEDISIDCFVIGWVEFCGVLFAFLPAVEAWSKKIPFKEYKLDAWIGGTCLVLLAITVVIQLMLGHILKKRGSVYKYPGVALLKDVFCFALQKGEWGAADIVEDHLTREDIQNSPLLHHFSRKINLRATIVAVVLTPVFLLSLLGVIVAYARNSSGGINLFSRSTAETAGIGGKLFITIICIGLCFLYVAALVRIKVKIGNLRADIVKSGIPLQDLDQEFLSSQCIGHDIWVGEKHIFMSGGSQAYMFLVDDIFEIEQGDIRGNHIPYCMLTVTSLTGEQANLISFDSHMKEKLETAINRKKNS